MTPRRQNVSFHPTSAAAQHAGFRACKRCRPDATPGSPDWSYRSDVVARAMRLIADGVVDRHGVAGLSRDVGYSERQLHRLLVAEVGAGAIALARAQRSQTARMLIETTTLSFVDVAFAAGFASLRQFNDTIREVFASTPTELRRGAERGGSQRCGGDDDHRNASGPSRQRPGGVIRLRLAVRAPFAVPQLLAFLAVRAVPGIESATTSWYRRTLHLPHGDAVMQVRPGSSPESVDAVLGLEDVRDLPAAVARARRLLDADADPVAVDELLSADPRLAASVAAEPGLRSVGAADATEVAIRAVLGQQVSVAAARTAAHRLAERFGRTCRVAPVGFDDVNRVFPSAEVLAGVDPADIAGPRRRARAVVDVAIAVAEGRVRLDAGADRAETRARLLEVSGVGPWTADYIVMRALGDPDVMLPTDLGARHGAAVLGVDPSELADPARWSPWRSTALHHLWLAATTATTATATATADTDTPTIRRTPEHV